MSNNINNFKWSSNVTAPRAPRISRGEWEQHRAMIVGMHEDGKTKQQISDAMAEHGFKPTLDQYTTQFKWWGLKRYKSSKLLHDQTSKTTLSSELDTDGSRTATPINSGTTSRNLILGTSLLSIAAISAESEQPDDEFGSVNNQNENDVAVEADNTSEFNPNGMDAQSPFADPSTEVMNMDDVLMVVDDDIVSETESVRTVGGSPPAQVTQAEVDQGRTSAEVSPMNTGRSIVSPTVQDITASVDAMSIQEPEEDPFQDFDSDATSFRRSCLNSVHDGESAWESIVSQSEVSLFTAQTSGHATALTDLSGPLPLNQYLDRMYPAPKLKRLRKFGTEYLFNRADAPETIKSILSEADFLRVSLLFGDAFDLYLFVYMLMSDPKIERLVLVDPYFTLQALTGCAESAQNLSQVRLCQEFLKVLTPYQRREFLNATGFPLKYTHGHLAALERNVEYAATCMRQAATEVGVLEFKDSAAVTSMLVHELIARFRRMNLSFNDDTKWLKDAQKRLRKGKLPTTMATAIRQLLRWCISTLVKEKLDTTIQDCFSEFPLALVTTAKGQQVPQDAFLMVVHFLCAWGLENDRDKTVETSFERAASALNLQQQLQKTASPSNEAIELISKEMQIGLTSIFTTISRMITEQPLTSATSRIRAQEADTLNRVRSNAIRLSLLTGEELEQAFIKAFFFVNTRAPELGHGLHPQRYLRALTVWSLPRRIVISETGPDWLFNVLVDMSEDRLDAQSGRSCSMSTTSSTRRLLFDDPMPPQPSPRSSISLRIREVMGIPGKRKQPPSVSSKKSTAPKALKRESTGSDMAQIEADRDLRMMLGLSPSMASLHL